jgi:hypothetical protein
MSEGQTLLLVLVLLYLSECVIWVKRQSVAFVPTSGRRWRVAFPRPWLGNASGGILIMNPLPPAGQIFLSHLSPISISPSGICAFNLQTLPSGARSPAQTGRFLAFREITSSDTDGVYLLINKERFAKCTTARQAKRFAILITVLLKASPAKRESLVRTSIVKQFPTDEAASALRNGEAIIKPIRWASAILFLFLFVATPILVVYFGLLRLIIPAAIVMFAFAILIGVLFYRAHRKLYPEETSERFESLVKMILCPPVSIRAADILTKNLLAHYSPVVLAGVLTGNSEQQFVRAFILDLQHPLKHEVLDETAENTIDWAAGEQLGICLEHVKNGSYAKAEELLAPTRREGNSVSYCPRCGCQFVVHSVECADCPGVELVAFSDHIEVDTGGSVSQTIPQR